MPAKTKSKTENFLYKKAEAVKVPKTEEKTANQALIWEAYKIALSAALLVNTLIALKDGNPIQTNKNPSRANAILL